MQSTAWRTTIVALGALLLAGAVWLVSSRSEPKLDLTNERTAARDAASSATPANSALRDPDRSDATARELAASSPPAATEPARQVLRVRLRGLHPDAPWTAPLRLVADLNAQSGKPGSDHDARAIVDAEGRAEFVLPEWWPDANRGHIDAEDEHYQPLLHRWSGTFDAANELVLDVQVTAILEGRVVDARTTPIANAMVVAYPMAGGVPADELLASTGVIGDGTYELRVPPNVPLFLMAVRVVPKRVRMPAIPSARPASIVEDTVTPGSCTIAGVVDARTRAPDLVLRDAAKVEGTARWNSGEGLQGATVHLLPRGGLTLHTPGDLAVQRHDDGSLTTIASARTDEFGKFVLPATAGVAADVALGTLFDMHVIGGSPTRAVVPPQRVEFVVPRPVALHATKNGRRVAKPRFEFDDARPATGNSDGELDVVLFESTRVRASHNRSRSAWQDLTVEQAGTTIALELADALSPVSIEFEGDFRVRNATIEWSSSDDRRGRQHVMRDDTGGPFELFLEPGQYRLRIGPGGGERNGVFLLPVERDVAVDAEPVKLVLPAVFGGTFVLIATDPNGLHVAGTCRVVAANGDDVTDHFTVDRNGSSPQGRPGEVMSGGPNRFTRILAPGDYELECDFVEHGARRGRVTIKPREVTEVRIRL